MRDMLASSLGGDIMSNEKKDMWLRNENIADEKRSNGDLYKDGKYQGYVKSNGDVIIGGNYKGKANEIESNENKSGCYLTTACISVQQDMFDDSCDELNTLRNFRDTYLMQNYPNEINEYYSLAPVIIDAINTQVNSKDIYTAMYNDLVMTCLKLIRGGQLDQAYEHYKSYSIMLSNQFLTML